ncbi:hypothetical protein [Alicyclobacillus sp. ALC3]|uniref:hypothetical protein n=1 Tax=Alicyclobacillus sp. ALC3 TaxID=2796143 RepID=UPI002378908F|nr:hypothetical protein [Alicyclobacillus sp. ALC3]WDL98871.1 hypothetical protein JC200_09555 [Alicyclobacillus sp. ALC3]
MAQIVPGGKKTYRHAVPELAKTNVDEYTLPLNRGTKNCSLSQKVDNLGGDFIVKDKTDGFEEFKSSLYEEQDDIQGLC